MHVAFDETAHLPGLRAGEPDACAAFVRHFAGPMLRVARGVLRNEDDARDALQDAFLKAFRGLREFDGRAQLTTWLHRVVVNAALDKLRRKQRRPEQSLEPLLPRFTADEHHECAPVAWCLGAEDAARRDELRQLVRRGI